MQSMLSFLLCIALLSAIATVRAAPASSFEKEQRDSLPPELRLRTANAPREDNPAVFQVIDRNGRPLTQGNTHRSSVGRVAAGIAKFMKTSPDVNLQKNSEAVEMAARVQITVIPEERTKATGFLYFSFTLPSTCSPCYGWTAKPSLKKTAVCGWLVRAASSVNSNRFYETVAELNSAGNDESACEPLKQKFLDEFEPLKAWKEAWEKDARERQQKGSEAWNKQQKKIKDSMKIDKVMG